MRTDLTYICGLVHEMNMLRLVQELMIIIITTSSFSIIDIRNIV